MDVDVKKCCFCNSSSEDEIMYGKFYEMNDIQTHYYCLLLSSKILQNGKDDEGILGFLIEDIRKEINRGKRLTCSYCQGKGATLFCSNSKCKKVFHLPCGIRNNSMHHFFGQFKSYCSKHRPLQIITSPVLEDSLKTVNNCAICFETVDPWPNINTLWAPCCSVNSWFHRNCIQKLALSAGYFFKCPLCNNKEYFQLSMLKQGIFIPEQDASWELVPNAFAELLERYEQCDADTCLCPRGRKYMSSRTRWDIVLCRLCGSQGIHIGCGKLRLKRPVWECSNCISMLQSAKKRHSNSEIQPCTISDNISESDGMSRLSQSSSNIDSPDTDTESLPYNTIGLGASISILKAIKSDTIERVSPEDEIEGNSAVLGNTYGYVTRARVRQARHSKSCAENMPLYKEKYNLKEVRIVLRKCDEDSMHWKAVDNKNLRAATSKLERNQSIQTVSTDSLSIVFTNSSEEQVDTKMDSKCLQMETSITWTNKLSAFIFDSDKEVFDCKKMSERKTNPEFRPTFSVRRNIEQNNFIAQICVPKQIHGNQNSKVLYIIGNVFNKTYSRIFYKIPSSLNSLDIHCYGNIRHFWNQMCAQQGLCGLVSSYKSFNFSFIRQIDVHFACNNRRKRKLMDAFPRQAESFHELFCSENCTIETSSCVCKIKTLKLINNTSQFLQYKKQRYLSENMVSDCYLENKIQKLKDNPSFSDFSKVNQETVAKFNISENSYNLKYIQPKVVNHHSVTVNQGKTPVLLEKNIVSSVPMSSYKKLNEPLTFCDIYAATFNSDKHRNEFFTSSVNQQFLGNIASISTKSSKPYSDNHDFTLQTISQEKCKQNSDENSTQIDSYPCNESDDPNILCVLEKYGFCKETMTLTGFRSPQEYTDQIAYFNAVGISCHNSFQSDVKKLSTHSYTENYFFNDPFANKLWDVHNITETGWKEKYIFNTPNKDLCNNKNLYEINQNPLYASFTLESLNIEDPKRTSGKSECNLLNIFRQTENCKSKRSQRKRASARENNENILMLDESRHHFQRNHTDEKDGLKRLGESEKINVFNLEDCGSLCSENNMAKPISFSRHSTLSAGSFTSKNLAVNELKRLGAIRHCPKRITLKQINSESKLINFFDFHSDKIYRGLGIKYSVLK